MMFLSHLLINTGENPDRPRPGRLWLRNIYHVHQRLSMAFPSRELKDRDPVFLQPYDPEAFEPPRFLFRIDRGIHGQAMRTMILVQSEDEPDWDYAFQNAPGLLAAPPQTHACDWNWREADRCRFRLLANPTKKTGTLPKEQRKSKVPGRHGRRVPIYDREAQVEWLLRNGERGFAVDPDSLQISVGCFKQGRKIEFADTDTKEHNLKFAAVQFDGILSVTDRTKFEAALKKGIGSGKGFGFGLLSVLPARDRTNT